MIRTRATAILENEVQAFFYTDHLVDGRAVGSDDPWWLCDEILRGAHLVGAQVTGAVLAAMEKKRLAIARMHAHRLADRRRLARQRRRLSPAQVPHLPVPESLPDEASLHSLVRPIAPPERLHWRVRDGWWVPTMPLAVRVQMHNALLTAVVSDVWLQPPHSLLPCVRCRISVDPAGGGVFDHSATWGGPWAPILYQGSRASIVLVVDLAVRRARRAAEPR